VRSNNSIGRTGPAAHSSQAAGDETNVTFYGLMELSNTKQGVDVAALSSADEAHWAAWRESASK